MSSWRHANHPYGGKLHTSSKECVLHDKYSVVFCITSAAAALQVQPRVLARRMARVTTTGFVWGGVPHMTMCYKQVLCNKAYS